MEVQMKYIRYSHKVDSGRENDNCIDLKLAMSPLLRCVLLAPGV